MDPVTKKRQINQIILDGLRHSDKPIPFFCECARDECYQAAWLTCEDFERNLEQPGWRALSDTHWELSDTHWEQPARDDVDLSRQLSSLRSSSLPLETVASG